MDMHEFFKHKMKVGFLAPSALLLVLAGCGGGGGGGGGGGSPAAMLSGTAAAGAAIIGQVTVKGSAGNTVSALIEANGNYNVDVSTLTAPYVLRAEGTVGGRTYNLHSYAEDADIGGTVNITPFTDLIVANAAGQIASAYFDDFVTQNTMDPITTAELEAQETALQAKLQAVFDDLGVDAAVDLLHTTFSADHTQLDAALDLVRISDTDTSVVTITNLIDGTTITDNVVDATDNDTVLVVTTDLGTIQTDYEAIAGRFADFSALFAAGLPNASQLDPFFSVDFLHSDQNKAQFQTMLSTDPNFAGLAFANVSIETLDQTAGTASVSFHIGFNDVVEPQVNYMEMVKTADVWQLHGDREIVDRYVSYICDHGSWPDGSEFKTCGINLSAEDGLAANNPGGTALVDSARVTLLRNGTPVTGVEIFMGVPAVYGAAGELFIYDSDYNDDFMPFGTGAFELDPSLIQAGDQWQFELYTAALNLTDTNNPAVVSTPVATYTSPVVTVPATNAATASYPAASQATLDALAAYSGGNLTVQWTIPSGMQNEGVLFEVCDGIVDCSRVEEWSIGGSSPTTLTIDTSSLDLTSSAYSAELRVYAMDIYGQSFLRTYRVDTSGVGGSSSDGGGTGGGSTLACTTESGWDDTADGGLGAPVTPYSFADFEAVIADCGTAQTIARADVAGSSFSDAGDIITLNDTGAAATAAEPETGSFSDGLDTTNFKWYVESAGTHSYLVVYSNNTIDSNLPVGFSFRETSAVTGIVGSTFSFVNYTEQSNYGDMDRAVGSDGEIWSSTRTLQ